MTYVLVDCNNFYVSCERLFNPRLEGRPVIVLSNNDGCVVARSQEAKQLNIKMGEPFFKIRNLCLQHSVVVYSSNYKVYGDLSQRVMQVLTDMAPEIQIYSIDEAFLAYPPTMPANEILAHCIDIRRKVKKWVGIPTSIGIAPTKTLAKAANDMAKKDRTRGVFDMSFPAVREAVLKDFPVEDVWGIGSRTAAKLRALGVYTAAEFCAMDAVIIRRKFGVVGERMLWELRGVSCLPLEEAAAKKSITCSRSFGKAVTEEADLAEALATYANTACIKLRQQDSCAKALCAFVEILIDPQAGTRSYASAMVPFAVPTSDTPQIISAAKRCLPVLFREGQRYKKCGVILLDLVAEADIIPDLFLGAPDPHRQHVMRTVDALNARFGKNAVFFGAMGVDPRWKARSSRRTQAYTTEWDSLALAKA